MERACAQESMVIQCAVSDEEIEALRYHLCATKRLLMRRIAQRGSARYNPTLRSSATDDLIARFVGSIEVIDHFVSVRNLKRVLCCITEGSMNTATMRKCFRASKNDDRDLVEHERDCAAMEWSSFLERVRTWIHRAATMSSSAEI